jgi:hypothetical protein
MVARQRSRGMQDLMAAVILGAAVVLGMAFAGAI